MFVWFEFMKIGKPDMEKLPKIVLTPCVYKKRWKQIARHTWLEDIRCNLKNHETNDTVYCLVFDMLTLWDKQWTLQQHHLISSPQPQCHISRSYSLLESWLKVNGTVFIWATALHLFIHFLFL